MNPREEVLERLLGVFRDRGYDGCSLSDLSEAAGLGRSSLYHHFPGGKPDMALAALAHLDGLLATTVSRALTGEGGPEERLRATLQALDAFYEGGRRACLLERLAGSVDHERFRGAVSKTFAGLVEGLTELAVAAGVARDVAEDRAEDAVARVQGSLVFAAGSGDPGAFGRALARIQRDLLATA